MLDPHPDAQSEELPDADRAVLDLEEGWQSGRLVGDKESLIRERLGLTAPRYYLRLNELIDDERAARYAPSLVGRLARVRGQRREARSARLLG